MVMIREFAVPNATKALVAMPREAVVLPGVFRCLDGTFRVSAEVDPSNPDIHYEFQVYSEGYSFDPTSLFFVGRALQGTTPYYVFLKRLFHAPEPKETDA